MALSEPYLWPRVYKIHLRGATPSKKNLYRRRAGSGMYITKPVKAVLDALQLQIQSQWSWPPLERASLEFKFYVKKDTQDVDNKMQACLDLLVKSGVIKDDRIKCLPKISAEAVMTNKEETVEITVYPLA
jgi:Holliday junction resolvase RusA-like endonuclease